jgi:hypothetical protein
MYSHLQSISKHSSQYYTWAYISCLSNKDVSPTHTLQWPIHTLWPEGLPSPPPRSYGSSAVVPPGSWQQRLNQLFVVFFFNVLLLSNCWGPPKGDCQQQNIVKLSQQQGGLSSKQCTYNQCFGSASVLCGSGSSIFAECGSGSYL